MGGPTAADWVCVSDDVEVGQNSGRMFKIVESNEVDYFNLLQVILNKWIRHEAPERRKKTGSKKYEALMVKHSTFFQKSIRSSNMTLRNPNRPLESI